MDFTLLFTLENNKQWIFLLIWCEQMCRQILSDITTSYTFTGYPKWKD